jgi:hypothetical protein
LKLSGGPEAENFSAVTEKHRLLFSLRKHFQLLKVFFSMRYPGDTNISSALLCFYRNNPIPVTEEASRGSNRETTKFHLRIQLYLRRKLSYYTATKLVGQIGVPALEDATSTWDPLKFLLNMKKVSGLKSEMMPLKWTTCKCIG